MFPIQSRLEAMSARKAAAPIASTVPAQPVTFSYSSSSSISSTESYDLATPPPTPTIATPIDSLLDITPRKSSFSSEQGAAYAFPSWPKRVSLTSHDSLEDVCVNSRISDEDLLWIPENAGTEPLGNEATETEGFRAPTQEELIMQEQRHRANFLAKVDAHARATHALRQEKQAMSARDAKPKKRRVATTPKRRAHSASKVMAQ